MSNGYRGRCGRRPVGCLNSVGGLHPWGGMWNGGCPDAGGGAPQPRGQGAPLPMGGWPMDGDDRRGCRNRRDEGVFGLYTAGLPMAVPANGVIPLAGGLCDGDRDIAVNSGVLTLYRPGLYLATVIARLGAGTTLDSTVTLNVNEATQSSAVLQLAGAGPQCATGQALFEVMDQALVTLRSSEPIQLATPAAQPLFTLSLVRLED